MDRAIGSPPERFDSDCWVVILRASGVKQKLFFGALGIRNGDKVMT
jgi:hypothetical protein